MFSYQVVCHGICLVYSVTKKRRLNFVIMASYTAPSQCPFSCTSKLAAQTLQWMYVENLYWEKHLEACTAASYCKNITIASYKTNTTDTTDTTVIKKVLEYISQ